MTTVGGLGSLHVEVMYNPTNIMSPTGTWTDITSRVRDLRTTAGRQRMLDRVETGTMAVLLDNRDGYFTLTEGAVGELRTRLPIRVRMSLYGTMYDIFYGITDSVTERLNDEMNIDIEVGCSDYLRLISLRNCYNNTYYQSTFSSQVSEYMSCDAITSSNTLTNERVGNKWGNANIVGTAASTDTVLLYDEGYALDLTAGTGIASAYIEWQAQLQGASLTLGTPGALFPASIDFWVYIPSGAINQPLIVANWFDGLFYSDASINIDSRGCLTSFAGNIPSRDIYVADDDWHHIGLTRISSYNANNMTSYDVYVDGVKVSVYNAATRIGDGNQKFKLGCTYVNYLGIVPVYTNSPANTMFFDEIVIVDDSAWTAANGAEIQARYAAGVLLRKDVPSAKRIHEVLTLTGFAGLDYYNGTAYTSTQAIQGTQWVQGEVSSVVNKSALDLILVASDTEVGNFWQRPDGGFEFDGRDYWHVPSTRAFTQQAGFCSDGVSGNIFYQASNLMMTNDDYDIWTRVVVNPVNGESQQYDSGNTSLYGSSTMTRSSQPTSLADALSTAEYLGYVYQSPLRRVSSVDIRSEGKGGTNLTSALPLRLFDNVLFNREEFGNIWSTDMVIERISHEFSANPGSWRMSFILDPYPIRNRYAASSPVLVLDDTTYGRVDANVVL